MSFLEDPDTFFVELKQLTIRHIKYGVKADYAKAFGTAVLRGIETAIGKEEFPQDLREAWELLWDRVSNCLTRCLNAGTNLVIVALVNGDLEKAKEAMDCAPRGERFDTLTLVSTAFSGEQFALRLTMIYNRFRTIPNPRLWLSRCTVLQVDGVARRWMSTARSCRR